MIPLRANTPPQDPDEAAAWWSARRRLGLPSTHEHEAFEKWQSDPINAAAWEAVELMMDEVGDYAALPEIRALRAAALNAARPHGPGGRRWLGPAAIAASLVAGLIWLAAPVNDGGVQSGAETHAPATARYATLVGERRSILLSDGSAVTLNTSSTLEVAYSATHRNVRLLGGQALFHVAKDTTRPFVVGAGDRLITATGTAFDVRVRDNGNLSVLLVEGRVIVEPVRRKGLARLLPALAEEELEPGQHFAVSPGGEETIQAADMERATSWSRGQLIFRDDPVGAAVAEMNRYSLTKILIAHSGIANLRISGVFGTGRTENFVAALTAFYPVKATQKSRGLIELHWSEERGPHFL